jgi:epoxyqueuosine reductase
MDPNLDLLKEMGFDYRLVPLSRLENLETWMKKISEEKSIDPEISRYIQNFKYQVPEDFPEARSILIVAGQAPSVQLIFQYQGKKNPVIIPPTYRSLNPDPITILADQGIKIRYHRIPFKLTAVCSGLMDYGRNNITYHSKWGSFTRLQAYITNVSPQHDFWREPALSKTCESCQLCLKHCPTQAINHDRFVIHQSRCLTLHNETIEPFPNWVDPKWHNSLVGCMKCQQICPMDQKFKEILLEGGELTENDTISLLKAKEINDLTPKMKEILEQECLLEDFGLIARNFLALGANID